MKRFITNSIIFAGIVALSIAVLFTLVDGYTDPFYKKFASPKQDNLILGTSKSAQGVNPFVLKELIGEEVFNYSFTVGISPYGPKYFESIKKKLSDSKKDRLFILTVDFWSVASTAEHPNSISDFRENKSCISKIDNPTLSPNIPYFINCMKGKYHQLVIKQKVAFLHDNGWLDVSLPNDTLAVNRRTKATLLEYSNVKNDYKFSQVRFNYLEKTIQLLNDHGRVYLVRLPVSKEFSKIEQELMPDFNKKIKYLENQTNGYLDFTSKNTSYTFTDGVHLEKESANQVSKEISLWINNLNTTSINP